MASVPGPPFFTYEGWAMPSLVPSPQSRLRIAYSLDRGLGTRRDRGLGTSLDCGLGTRLDRGLGTRLDCATDDIIYFGRYI